MSDSRDWNAHNREVIAKFRATGGKIDEGANPLMLLTTTGAKSGLTRVNPLCYSTDGDRIIIIASKGAAPTHPDWYFNLVAHPEVTVEVGPDCYRAQASIAEGAERERLFNQQAALMPFFAEYQRQVVRQIPVVILERINV